MTDKYITWIDKQIAKRKKIYASIERNSPKVPDPLVEFHDVGIASLLANRAVLVRHKERLSVFHNCGEEDCREMGARRILESVYTDITDQLEKELK